MKNSSPKIAARVVQTLFGISFCIPAVAIFVMMSRGAVQMRAARDSWVSTPCVILDAKVRDADNGNYALSVRYRYEFLGASHVSTRYSPMHEEHRFDSISERDTLLATYGKDASAMCLVNPSAPEEAVLVASTDREEIPIPVYFFLLGFIVVGLLVALSPWWSLRRHRGAGPGAQATGSGAEARDAKDSAPLWTFLIPIAFCSVFIAVGCGLMAFGVRQRAQMRASREWPLAEGVVERIEVKREWQSGSKGRHGRWLYSPYVVYAYDVDGVRRENDRFGIIKSSSSKPDAAQQFVEEHPIGSPIGVRYNPADPTDSVLDMPDAAKRSFVDEWMLTGVGAVFALFGAGFLLIMSMEWRRRRAPAPMPGGVLRRRGRGAEFVQMLVFSVLWCFGISVLCAGFFSDMDWPPKGEDWIPAIMLSVFACIGVGLLVRTLRKALRMGGPHLEIRCPRGFVARGGETDFSYRLVGGRVEDVESVVVRIVAWREEHVRRRDEARIEARAAYRAEVLRAATPHEIGQGFFRVELPADAPPSGPDGRETVRWELAVSGHCRNRPGFSDTYPIQVRG